MVVSAIDQGKSREGRSEVPGSAYIHSFKKDLLSTYCVLGGGNSKSDGVSTLLELHMV